MSTGYVQNAQMKAELVNGKRRSGITDKMNISKKLHLVTCGRRKRSNVELI